MIVVVILTNLLLFSFNRVEEREKLYRKEQEDALNNLENMCINTKKGIDNFNDKLEELRTDETTTNSRLKSVLAKSASAFNRHRTNRGKRDKKENDQQNQI